MRMLRNVFFYGVETKRRRGHGFIKHQMSIFVPPHELFVIKTYDLLQIPPRLPILANTSGVHSARLKLDEKKIGPLEAGGVLPCDWIY
jgi:hypothetical protein